MFIKFLFSIFLKITFDFLYACVECTGFLRLSNRQIKTTGGRVPKWRRGWGVRGGGHRGKGEGGVTHGTLECPSMHTHGLTLFSIFLKDI